MANVVLWLTLLVAPIAHTKFVVDLQKSFRPCENSKAPFPVDISGLRIFLSEDDDMTFDGPIVVTKDMRPPLGFAFYSQKQEHGEWMPMPYGKRVLDLCAVLLSASDVWHPITSNMNQTRCPFKKHHTEHFHMLKTGLFGFEDYLQEFTGEWRIFVELTVTRVAPFPEVSCIMTEVSIVEH
ncbi:uncharacterized protein LOC126572982 [Anopheles aquasalis]|uniref:uncharacterized protein LOC126572982 n=1 Tax=Anopheles aquasalis TaxID=42839 RepID=UPI00215A7FFA|nr:uncharacterized protein LOC126572982 [Anopheles aquasalis]